MAIPSIGQDPNSVSGQAGNTCPFPDNIGAILETSCFLSSSIVRLFYGELHTHTLD